ncbi:hypothetical protein [Pedobacter metabolipauper]|uniref:Uncharacterized protein n=1 Tax=Pedobacter metabolipauper TaxID=425513 RepID=A0A4R6SZP3_9SPHI|nr:hypothetical protein [Pedobacter metabolipauper]TDQ11936.1 hypothetical protein ATK78_1066 [Pedobacter metabolipauper]
MILKQIEFGPNYFFIRLLVLYMDPFNIIIEEQGRKIDLNIHPQEAGSYKIVYHGGLVGEIFMGAAGENWEAVSIEDLDPGTHPMYEYQDPLDDIRFILKEPVVQKIGDQISRSYS